MNANQDATNMSDKYRLEDQMYARMVVARHTKSRNGASVNYGFGGGDDSSVEEAIKILGCSEAEFIEDVNNYVGDGCGIRG